MKSYILRPTWTVQPQSGPQARAATTESIAVSMVPSGSSPRGMCLVRDRVCCIIHATILNDEIGRPASLPVKQLT